MADLYSQVQKAIGATDSLLDLLDEDTEAQVAVDCGEEKLLKGTFGLMGG